MPGKNFVQGFYAQFFQTVNSSIESITPSYVFIYIRRNTIYQGIKFIYVIRDVRVNNVS